MLSQIEIKILKLIADKHLITRSELVNILAKEQTGALADINSLITKGLVKKLQGITQENSFVVTQSGLRILKE